MAENRIEWLILILCCSRAAIRDLTRLKTIFIHEITHKILFSYGYYPDSTRKHNTHEFIAMLAQLAYAVKGNNILSSFSSSGYVDAYEQLLGIKDFINRKYHRDLDKNDWLKMLKAALEITIKGRKTFDQKSFIEALLATQNIQPNEIDWSFFHLDSTDGPGFKSHGSVNQGEANRTMRTDNLGGIDLTPAKMNLETKMDSRLRGNDNGGGGNDSEGIKFHLDPAMLEQLRNAPGFVPVIINVQPLKSLPNFLGLNQPQAIVPKILQLKKTGKV